LDPRRTPSDASALAACSATMSDLDRPSRQNPARQIDLFTARLERITPDTSVAAPNDGSGREIRPDVCHGA
jgi:hypothetical protein